MTSPSTVPSTVSIAFDNESSWGVSFETSVTTAQEVRFVSITMGRLTPHGSPVATKLKMVTSGHMSLMIVVWNFLDKDTPLKSADMMVSGCWDNVGGVSWGLLDVRRGLHVYRRGPTVRIVGDVKE